MGESRAGLFARNAGSGVRGDPVRQTSPDLVQDRCVEVALKRVGV